MTSRKKSLVLGMVSLFTAPCFAQSSSQQIIKLPAGSTIKMQANSSNAVNYQWIKDGQMLEKANQNTYEVKIPGTYAVVTFNAQGCESEISDPIVFIAEPITTLVADVMIKKTAEKRSVTVNDPFEYLLTVTNNGADNATKINVIDVLPGALNFEKLNTPKLGYANYNTSTKTVSWQIDTLVNGQSAELKIQVRAITPGIIRNTATVSASETDPNKNNNTSEEDKSIIGIVIPNVFTPNGDNKNDAFEIPGVENYENEVTIVNRWGGTVYYSKSYKNDWKGEGLNEGTYYYVIKLRPAGGKWEIYKGYVTLLRTKK
ncbi:T9SS type B sorting domain-containing protein [Pedobacter sp. PWIIR3]